MTQALPVPAPPDRSIRINLLLPVTRWGVGFFSFDPIEQLIGAPLVSLLEPLMVGGVTRRPSQAGPAVEVYPLALPEGESATVPLGQWGELGFSNRFGELELVVPWQAAGWVQQRFAQAVVAGPERQLSSDGTAWVAKLRIQLTPGMRASWPMGSLGEVGVEAV
ncbi:MAG: hypothetical protein H6739_04605 [Alphaproteobacteria bacterium]|nr:hypothetical protein [Alphaproteobacteria bacterium]